MVVIDNLEVELAECIFEGCFHARKSINDVQIDFLQLAVL